MFNAAMNTALAAVVLITGRAEQASLPMPNLQTRDDAVYDLYRRAGLTWLRIAVTSFM